MTGCCSSKRLTRSEDSEARRAPRAQQLVHSPTETQQEARGSDPKGVEKQLLENRYTLLSFVTELTVNQRYTDNTLILFFF
jgi:hypothetical protein